MCSHFITGWSQLNPLMPILKLQSNEPLYCNTVIGTLAADEWLLHLVQRGWAWAGCGTTGSPPLSGVF